MNEMYFKVYLIANRFFSLKCNSSKLLLKTGKHDILLTYKFGSFTLLFMGVKFFMHKICRTINLFKIVSNRFS